MIYSPYGVLVEVTKVFDVYVVLIGLIVCEKYPRRNEGKV
jgi:hypothetical protein